LTLLSSLGAGRIAPLVACLVTLSLTRPAAAQSPAPPDAKLPAPEAEEKPPEEPESDKTVPTPGGVEGPARVGKWTASLAYDQLWESNARFTTVDPEGDFSSRLWGALARDWKTTRTTASVRAAAGGALYWQLGDLNRFFFSADLAGTRRAAPRLTLGARLTGTEDYARYLLPPTGAPDVLDAVFTKRVSGTGTAEYRTSRDDRILFEASGTAAHYDSATYPSSADAEGRLTWTRSRTGSNQLSAILRLGRSRSQGESGGIEDAAVRIESKLGRGFSGDLRGGVGLVRAIGNTSWEVVPTGEAALRYASKRMRVDAAVSRGSGMSYGFGRITVSNGISVTGSRDFTPRFSASLRGAFEDSRDPADETFGLTSTYVGALGRLRVRRTTSLLLAYDAYRQKATRTTETTTYGHTVRMSLAWDRVLR